MQQVCYVQRLKPKKNASDASRRSILDNKNQKPKRYQSSPFGIKEQNKNKPLRRIYVNSSLSFRLSSTGLREN